MAAQLYANTQLALALYDVLQELVEEGKVPEPLAVATLAQVGRAGGLYGLALPTSQQQQHMRTCSCKAYLSQAPLPHLLAILRTMVYD